MNVALAFNLIWKIAFAPAVTILAYELRGYQAATLAN